MACTDCGDSGLAYGQPRMGQPKTEEQRAETHGGTPPPHGTRLGRAATRQSLGANAIIFVVGFFLGGIAGYAFAKPKRAAGKAREVKGAFEE